MAAALTKTHHFLWKIGTRKPIPNPLSTKENITAHKLLHHNKRYSVLRKAKELEFHAPTVVSGYSKSGFVSWYLGMVKTRPVATKSITSAIIYAAADISSQVLNCAQALRERLWWGKVSEGYDLMRTLRMAGCGLVIMGPSLHYWFNFVSRIFPKRDIVSTLKKMALGQTVYASVINVMFLSGNAAMQGESSSEIVARLKRDFLPSMINGIIYWPVCDFLTFKFFPVHLQPLVSNSFSYLWTVYMTYMASLTKVATS